MILYICIYTKYIHYTHVHTHIDTHTYVCWFLKSFSYLRVNLKLALPNWSINISGENILYFLSLGKGNFSFSFNFSIFGNKYKNHIQVCLVFHFRFSLWAMWNMGLKLSAWINRTFQFIFTLRQFFLPSASKFLPVKLWNLNFHSYLNSFIRSLTQLYAFHDSSFIS